MMLFPCSSLLPVLEVEKFYQQCDPEKENLCLYGLPNETWEVNLPVDEVPLELPEPALGINFARDGMQEKEWVPLELPHLYSMHMMEQYKGAPFVELSPHVFAVADASYRAMMSNDKSQSTLVNEESGAEKTETTKLIMQSRMLVVMLLVTIELLNNKFLR